MVEFEEGDTFVVIDNPVQLYIDTEEAEQKGLQYSEVSGGEAGLKELPITKVVVTSVTGDEIGVQHYQGEIPARELKISRSDLENAITDWLQWESAVEASNRYEL